MAVLEVTRPARLSAIDTCAILIDGRKAGEIRPGQSLRCEIVNGEHFLQARLGIAVSSRVDFVALEGQAFRYSLLTPKWFEFDKIFLGSVGAGRPYFEWRRL
jgi:hypothetical protein